MKGASVVVKIMTPCEIATLASLANYKRSAGVWINNLEVLPSMKDSYHHGTIIFHDFEDPFLPKENAQDDNSKFFEFISPTISMWVQSITQVMPNFISNRILEDLLFESKPMNYESMVYVYGWMIEEHQPIGIDY